MAVNLNMEYVYQNDASKLDWGDVIGKSLNDLTIDCETKNIWKSQLQKFFRQAMCKILLTPKHDLMASSIRQLHNY